MERKKKEEIERLIDDYNNKMKEERDKMKVKIYVLNCGLPIDNFIYYTHSKVGVFNWKDYEDKITQEQFVDFYNNIDRSELPQGVEFEIKS